MTFIIESNDLYDRYFIEWLIEKLKAELISIVDFDKLNKFSKDINFVKVFLMSLNNIKFIPIKGHWKIFIDNNVTYNKQRLCMLCRFIDNGNLNHDPYPIYSKAVNRVTTNLSSYYKEYMEEM